MSCGGNESEKETLPLASSSRSLFSSLFTLAQASKRANMAERERDEKRAIVRGFTGREFPGAVHRVELQFRLSGKTLAGR